MVHILCYRKMIKQELIHMSKALFLDRDGIINEDFGYVFEPEQFVFKTEIFPLIKKFRQAGYKVFIVTNQSGIAREYYSAEDFIVLTQWMLTELNSLEASVDDVYYCPHHPVAGKTELTMTCMCRKPQPGMFFRAAEEYNINLHESIMIGDKQSDMEAAIAAKLTQAYWLTEDSDLQTLNSLAALSKAYNVKTTISTVTHLSQIDVPS